jgi:hypothetical protein
MAELILGPMLRYVDETRATVWVQTSAAATVGVDCEGGPSATGPTFEVYGHHYALVVLTGLEPGGSYPYRVTVDGEPVWPEPDQPFPASRIRPIGPDQPLRILFGSCRTSVPHDPKHVLSHGVDVLRAYAYQMAGDDPARWPSLLLLLGDQVYADEPPPELVELIEGRRDAGEEPGEEIADYPEYAELYRHAWSEPSIRWLLATVPSAMIFDDHDLRDDWNTSDAWLATMRAKQWWRRRVTAGLSAYWVYQHLGNLSPDELAADPVLAEVRESRGDRGELLAEFAWRADSDPDHYRWSFARDHGRNRLVILDSRCARQLTPGDRLMLSRSQWEWFDQRATGDLDHLLVGSSLPILLPGGVHQLERWNEAICDGAWGARAARLAERLRQGIDLEHWGAFRKSFDMLAKLMTELASGARGGPPAGVLLLSGDVHYSYLAQARLPRTAAPVHQIVCSPIRNPLARTLRLLNGLAAFGVAAVVGRVLARSAGVRSPRFSWRLRRGPFFHNAVGTLDLAGRRATLRFHTARIVDGDPPSLAAICEEPLGR